MSPTPMDRPSLRTNFTSAWLSDITVWQPSQNPQPGVPPMSRSGLVHCRAAAKARAAVVWPAPGGPVKSQACVISEALTAGSPVAVAVAGAAPERPASTVARAARAAAVSCSTTRS